MIATAPKTSDRELVAFHEAGHCVACIRHGSMLIRATILPDSDHPGVRGRAIRIQGSFIPAEIAIKLSGPVAQWERGRRVGPMLRGFGCGNDLSTTKDYILRMYHEINGEKIIDWLDTYEFETGLSMARKTISESWGAVLHIAERLMDKGEITGALASAIVRNHDQKRGKQ
jgi:hypothetical protein